MNLFNPSLPLQPGRPASGPLAIGIALTVMMTVYCTMLWTEWSNNPDLSHGFFGPLIFGYLVVCGRRIGPLRWVKPGLLVHTLLAGLLLGGLALYAFAGLFAASLAWSHALVLFILGLSLVCFLLGGLFILADERVRLLPFNWIILTAIFLWVLVAPLPTGTYARLTFALQSQVTGGVMTVLQFLGVPARQHGNVIELARTTVGVEEACSGVRSLISCIYAGLFFAAWQVRRPWRRLALILAAPLLALGMNFLRSLALTLLANAGVDITGAWHDATGFAILGVTAAILAGLAILMESEADSSQRPIPGPVSDRSIRWPYRIFWFFSGLTLLLAVFFHLNSRESSQPAPAVPDLARIVPAESSGWQVITPDDLYRFSGILQTTHLLERMYIRPTDKGPIQLTAYIAYWAPGQTTVSRVASHTPDACWPGAGWLAVPATGEHSPAPTIARLQLAPAEYRIFRNQSGNTQNVWFWHIFDGRVISYRDPYSIPALLHIALQYGFRRQGSQYFIRISCNRPWEEISDEPLVREILANLDRIGL
jgi:exosortase